MVTFVFFGAVWRGGYGQLVKDAAVLPSVVCITDALHLVTARLRHKEEKHDGER